MNHTLSYSYSYSDEFCMDGSDYSAFLQTCNCYCSYFSFCVYPDNSYYMLTTERWKQFLMTYCIPKPAQCEDDSEGEPGKRVWFICSSESVQALQQFEKSIFNLMDICGYNNPYSIEFERSDGSIFAYCHADDGLCWIEPKPDEDVSFLLKNKHWLQHN